MAPSSSPPQPGTGYDVQLKTLPSQTVVTMRKDTTPEGLPEAYGEMLPATHHAIQGAGGESAGPPFGAYHAFTPEHVDLEAGAPVVAAIEVEEPVRCYQLPELHVASLMHEGPYEGLGDAHAALQGWVSQQGHTRNGPPMEIYWTDPGAEPDTSKWRTELVQPVE